MISVILDDRNEEYEYVFQIHRQAREVCKEKIYKIGWCAVSRITQRIR